MASNGHLWMHMSHPTHDERTRLQRYIRAEVDDLTTGAEAVLLERERERARQALQWIRANVPALG